MTKIKISPSLLQKWNDIQKGRWNTTLADLEDYILGTYKPSLAAMRGTAYHKLLEEGPDKYLRQNGFQVTVEEHDMRETFFFTKEAADPAVALYNAFEGQMTASEAWLSKEFEVEGQQVISWMRTDLIEGDTIHDFKTSSRPKGWLDYLDAYQWKFYLSAVPEAREFRYHVFVLTEDRKQKNLFTNCQYSTFSFERTDRLETDILGEMAGLVRYLKRRPDLYRALIAKPKFNSL